MTDARRRCAPADQPAAEPAPRVPVALRRSRSARRPAAARGLRPGPAVRPARHAHLGLFVERGPFHDARCALAGAARPRRRTARAAAGRHPALVGGIAASGGAPARLALRPARARHRDGPQHRGDQRAEAAHDPAVPDRDPGIRRRHALRREQRPAVLGPFPARRRQLPAERPRRRRLFAAGALFRGLGQRPARLALAGPGDRRRRRPAVQRRPGRAGGAFPSATVWSAVVCWTICALVFLPLLHRASAAPRR